MAVPFIDLKRFEPGFLDGWNERVKGMSARAEFIGGAAVAKLEEKLSSYCDTAKAVTCANGTDAIQLALRALGIGAGDVVLVPEVTFWATYEAVVNVGASPYTVDCNLEDQAIDIELVRDLLLRVKPKAVIVVHLYGWGSGRLAELRELCINAGVPLVEDAAQAFGVMYQGRPIFSGAQIATTSFYPAKVLGAAGDGGAVFCRDPQLAEQVRQLANHGRVAHYGHGFVGWNSRLDALQAAYLDLSMDHLDARIASRRASAQRYREELSSFHALSVVQPPAGYAENGYCNVCLANSSEVKLKLEQALKANAISFGNIYPSPVSVQPGAGYYLKGAAGGENAKRICEHVLNLPLFPYMTDEEITGVISVVEMGLG